MHLDRKCGVLNAYTRRNRHFEVAPHPKVMGGLRASEEEELVLTGQRGRLKGAEMR